MGLASFKTKVKLSGSATVMTSQAMSTQSTVANTFQINSTARRVWNPNVTPTFRGNGSTIAAANVNSIDYLFGRVTFTGAQTTPITVSGSYLPLTDLAGANTYTLNLNGELLDDTEFGSEGFRSRKRGLFDATLTVSRWDDIELETHNALSSDTQIVCEVAPGGSTSLVARGFFKVESDAHSGDVGALETADVTFQLDARDEITPIKFGKP